MWENCHQLVVYLGLVSLHREDWKTPKLGEVIFWWRPISSGFTELIITWGFLRQTIPWVKNFEFFRLNSSILSAGIFSSWAVNDV